MYNGFDPRLAQPTDHRTDRERAADEDRLLSEQQSRIDRMRRDVEINAFGPDSIYRKPEVYPVEMQIEHGIKCAECGHIGIYRGGLCKRCWGEMHS